MPSNQSNPLSLAHAWADLAKAAIPKGATEKQRRDMRCCFFAGAVAVMTTLNAVEDALSGGKITDVGASDILGMLKGECDAFTAETIQMARDYMAKRGMN